MLFFVALASSLVSAQLFYITDPVLSTVWVPGSVATISWLPTEQAFVPTTLDIAIMSGPDTNAATIMTIAKDIDPSSRSFEYLVPESLDGKAIFLKMTGKDGAKLQMNYSGRFNVSGEQPTPADKGKVTKVEPVDADELDSGASALTVSLLMHLLCLIV